MSEAITFSEFDKFQRKPFAERLTTVIEKFSPLYEEAFVLGLNASFGSGKTTFLKMWKKHLEDSDFSVIYINAWDNDFDEDPILPIVSAFIDAVGEDDTTENLLSALRGSIGAAALIGNMLLEKTTGIDAHDIMQKVEGDEHAVNIEKIGDDVYKSYSYKKTVYEELRQQLNKYAENISKKPVVILIDELDRVRPNYAVSFLEAIKHIFSVQGLCFVIAVDREQLKASVKQLYGDVDFENYYLRFITREADLPNVHKLDLDEYIAFLGQNFFDEKNFKQINFAFKQESLSAVLDKIKMTCRVFELTPRQIETFFRCFAQIMAVSTYEKFAKLQWTEAAILLVALFIKDKIFYRKLGNRELSVVEAHKYFLNLHYEFPANNNYKRQIILSFFSFIINESNKNQIADLSLNLEFLPIDKEEGIEDQRRSQIHLIAKYVDDFGHIHDNSVFEHIYKIIENWDEFIK